MRKIALTTTAAVLAFGIALTGMNLAFAVGGTAPQSLNVKVTATIDPTVDLTLDHDTGASPIAFGNVNPVTGVYTTGVAPLAGQLLNATIKSNSGWSLKLFKAPTVIAGACTAVVSDMADSTCTKVLPSTALQWKAGAGAFAQITGTNLAGAQTVATSATSTASTAVVITYQLTIGWADEAGTYSALHTYTLTQP